jgi:hypothetical protein
MPADAKGAATAVALDLGYATSNIRETPMASAGEAPASARGIA